MTTVKCRAVGNSQGVLIPAGMREQLRLREGGLMSAAVIEGALVLRPVSERTATILDQSVDLFDRHADALQELGNE